MPLPTRSDVLLAGSIADLEAGIRDRLARAAALRKDARRCGEHGLMMLALELDQEVSNFAKTLDLYRRAAAPSLFDDLEVES